MENNNPDYVYNNVIQIDDADSTRKYIANVFAWMFAGLGISAFVAFEFYLNQDLKNLLINPVTGGLSGFGTLAIFSPVIFSFVISFGYTRISYPVFLGIYIAYAIATGTSLSILGSVYTGSSIFGVFISSAVIFGVMAIAGYTTNMDLTKFGSILIMFFWGAFAVSMINYFLGSSQMDYIISFVFAFIMIGLTAYYMQMLKRIGAGIEFGTDSSNKLVLIGAFVLYTTFINLFLSLLRIFGRRR